YSDTCCRSFIYFFFFQAEDGIRDRNVTGVQTCALPIYPPRSDERSPVPYCAVETFRPTEVGHVLVGLAAAVDIVSQADRERRVRSEERRVGRECGWWRSWEGEKEKRKREKELRA